MRHAKEEPSCSATEVRIINWSRSWCKIFLFSILSPHFSIQCRQLFYLSLKKKFKFISVLRTQSLSLSLILISLVYLYEQAIDLISAVKELHGLSSQELNKLLRDSENFTIHYHTEKGLMKVRQNCQHHCHYAVLLLPIHWRVIFYVVLCIRLIWRSLQPFFLCTFLVFLCHLTEMRRCSDTCYVVFGSCIPCVI